MTMNLRVDNTSVQNDGWYRANERYSDFIRSHEGLRVLFLELGVGMNTPGIIKYPFWHMVHELKNASYVCINAKEAYAPAKIKDRAVCIHADIKEVLEQL